MTATMTTRTKAAGARGGGGGRPICRRRTARDLLADDALRDAPAADCSHFRLPTSRRARARTSRARAAARASTHTGEKAGGTAASSPRSPASAPRPPRPRCGRAAGDARASRRARAHAARRLGSLRRARAARCRGAARALGADPGRDARASSRGDALNQLYTTRALPPRRLRSRACGACGPEHHGPERRGPRAVARHRRRARRHARSTRCCAARLSRAR